ncbi:MAG: WD40 repeat domain-containing protein [Pseudomonadota bacterium]
MVLRRPLTTTDGRIEELPVGDTLPPLLSPAVPLTHSAGSVLIDPSVSEVFTFSAQQATQQISFANVPQTARATVLLTGDEFGTPYALAAASYDNKSVYLGGQSSLISGITVSPDGSKMFAASRTPSEIYSFSLATPGDMSTATFDFVSLDVSLQEANANAIAMSPDGTRLFMTGYSSDAVYQYSLSTAWDLSTASYDNVSFYIGTEELSVAGFAMSPDGTRMFIVGPNSRRIFQYSLSTAWDLSTASYDNVSLWVGSNSNSPVSITFSGTGLHVLVLDSQQKVVYQYNLLSSYSLTGASYANLSYNFTVPENIPSAIEYGMGGEKLYMIGFWQVRVYQYSTLGGLSPAVFTYDPSVQWPGGMAPSSPGAGETNLLDFLTTNGGTTWYGTERGADFS